MQVAKALWDSWADDAVLDDRASGHYARADRIRPINHEGKYYRVAGPAQHAARAAGAAGVRAGRLVRHRPPLRRAPCRGGLHRADGKGDRAGILCRPEEAGGGRGPRARARADPARPQPRDRLDRDGGEAACARAERTHRPRSRAQAAERPVRRPRLLASAARPAADAGGLPRSRHRRRPRAAAPR